MKLPVNLNMQTHIFIFLSHCICMGVSKKRFVMHLQFCVLRRFILTPVENFEVELRHVRLYLTDSNCMFDIFLFI